MMESLNISTINLQRSSIALQHAIACKPGELILAQEPPHCVDGRGRRFIPPQEGVTIIGTGRAAIICPMALAKHTTIVHISDCVVAILYKSFKIVSYYHDANTKYHHLPGLDDNSSTPANFILGGDFNAHHERWSKTKRWTLPWERGLELNELVNSLNLCISSTREPTQNYGHVIDFFIHNATPTKPAVQAEIVSTDHRMVSIGFLAPVAETHRRVKDWHKFAKEVNAKLESWTCPGDIDQAECSLTKIITDGLSKYRSKHSSPAWFSRKLEELRDRICFFQKQCRRMPRCVNLRDNLKGLRKTYHKAIQEAKRDYKDRLIKSLKHQDGSIWKAIRRQKTSRQLIGILDGDNSPEESLEKITNKFFRVESFRSMPELPPSRRFTPVTSNEVSSAIKGVNSNAATGKDEISYKIIKTVAPSLLRCLADITNLILSTGIYPSSWKQGTTVLIPKGKVENDVKNIRPITLTSCLGKTVEAVINKRLQSQLSTCWSCDNHGFREGKSTISALMRLRDKALTLKKNRVSAAMIVADVSSAFDKVCRRELVDTLERYVSTAEGRVINSYLQRRSTNLCYGATTMQINTEAGLPQGGVLSPTLWNLASEEFIRQIHHRCGLDEGSVIAYADDITVLVKGKDDPSLCAKIEEVLEVIRHIAASFSLKMDQNKTKVMPIGRLRHLSTSIEVVSECKILGLVWTPSITWCKHIKYAADKLDLIREKVGNFLRNPLLSHEAREIVLKMLAMPILAYGCEIWGKALKYKIHQKRLDSSLARFLIAILGLPRTARYANVYALMNCAPAHLLIKESLTKLELNNGRIPTAEEYKHLAKWGQRRCVWKPNPWEEKPFIVEIEKEAAARQKAEGKAGPLDIFTDGSFYPHNLKAGAACIVRHGSTVRTIHLKLKTGTDIYNAELAGLHAALNFVIENDLHGTHTRIFTDSQSSLMSILSGGKGSFLVEKINCLARKFTATLSFHWVPAHKGTEFNELADIAAKQAANCSANASEVPSMAKWIRNKKVHTVAKELHDKWLRNADLTGLFEGLTPNRTRILATYLHSKPGLQSLAVNRPRGCFIWQGTRRCPACGSIDSAQHVLSGCDRIVNIYPPPKEGSSLARDSIFLANAAKFVQYVNTCRSQYLTCEHHMENVKAHLEIINDNG